MQTIQSFIESNPAIKDDLAAQAAAGKTDFTLDDIKSVAAAHGVDATELDTADLPENGELSDEMLSAVTGGGKISFSLGGFNISVNLPW